jgi:cytoskeleton protein RodZ
LAVLLKVPVKKLEALEADRFDLLPDAVFVRALASSVCRTLKINAVPVLQNLPQNSQPTLNVPGIRVNTPFRAPGDGPAPTILTQLSRPAVLAGLALLLGALLLFLWPAVKTGMHEVSSDVLLAPANKDTVNSGTTEPVVDMGSAEGDKPHASTQELLSPVAGASGAVSTVQLSALSAMTATSVVSAAALPANAKLTAVAPISVGPASVASPQSPAGIVTFRATGSSWVEVTDAKGQLVLRRILNAGEVVGVSGALPLAAVVGRADVTQVMVRGKAFDISAITKDNVARFEVK